MTAPKRLNIGSGKDFQPEFLNVDINDHWAPDLVADVSGEFPPSNAVETRRFGKIVIEPGSFDQWLTERYGKGTILKETIGEYIVTLSFTGIAKTALWEVAEYDKRRRRVMVYTYASSEEGMESYFDSVQRLRREG